MMSVDRADKHWEIHDTFLTPAMKKESRFHLKNTIFIDQKLLQLVFLNSVKSQTQTPQVKAITTLEQRLKLQFLWWDFGGGSVNCLS